MFIQNNYNSMTIVVQFQPDHGRVVLFAEILERAQRKAFGHFLPKWVWLYWQFFHYHNLLYSKETWVNQLNCILDEAAVMFRNSYLEIPTLDSYGK